VLDSDELQAIASKELGSAELPEQIIDRFVMKIEVSG
jgi:hypothetical protein